MESGRGGLTHRRERKAARLAAWLPGDRKAQYISREQRDRRDHVGVGGAWEAGWGPCADPVAQGYVR